MITIRANKQRLLIYIFRIPKNINLRIPMLLSAAITYSDLAESRLKYTRN